jgi:hypothetical protein
MQLSVSNLGWDICSSDRSFPYFLKKILEHSYCFDLFTTASFQMLSHSTVFLLSELSRLHTEAIVKQATLLFNTVPFTFALESDRIKFKRVNQKVISGVLLTTQARRKCIL